MSQKNRKLGRTSDQRRAMLRAMVTYLLENGQIKTTVTRAKEVAPVAEKMITLAKTNTLASYRQALSYITKEDVANKLFTNMSARMAESIRDDLEVTTNVRMKDVEDAQQRIVGVIRDLEERNEIIILKGGKDDIIA